VSGLSLAILSLPSFSMSSTGKRVRKPEPYVCGKDTPPQPGDEVVGEYSRERLIKMHERFVERVERAFETGRESRQSAAMNGANASRPR
jgi:hypothetical protein